MDHRIKDWLPTLADAKRAPAERAFEYALMLGLVLFTAPGISPDTRLGYALVALGFAFAFAVLWGVVGRAKREWAAPSAPQDKAFLAPRSNIPTPVTPIASVAPAKRQLPTYEIEQKLMRYALLAIIRERTAYIEGEGNGIKNNAWYAARLDAADRAKKIHDFREKAGATIQELQTFSHCS